MKQYGEYQRWRRKDEIRTAKRRESILQKLARTKSFHNSNEVERNELMQIIADALATLDTLSQEIICMRFYCGMTITDISDQTQRNRKTVARRIESSLRKLQDHALLRSYL